MGGVSIISNSMTGASGAISDLRVTLPSFGTSHQSESNRLVQGVEPFSTWRDNRCPLKFTHLLDVLAGVVGFEPTNVRVKAAYVNHFIIPQYKIPTTAID